MLTTIVLAGVAVIAAYLYFSKYHGSKKYSLPPGPIGFPIVGNIFQLRPRIQLGLQKFKEQYGALMYIRLGTMGAVVLNSYDAIHDCFQQHGDLFSGRPTNSEFDRLSRKCGVLLTEGFTWQYHRRLSLRILRDFGFGRSGAEEIVKFEIGELRKILDKIAEEGNPIESRDVISNSISCVISQLIFGERPAFDDKDFAKYSMIAQDLAQNASVLDNLVLLVPRLRFLGAIFPRLLKLTNDIEFCHDYVIKKIEEHKSQMDVNDVDAESKDFCEAYIRAQKQALDAGEPFDDFNLVRTMFELFIAGTDTTATTLRWSFVYMAMHPVVQSKVQEELDTVIGRERLPNMTDKTSLNFTNATIDEIHRLSSIVPLAIGHRAMEDAQYKGYDIPSNVAVLANIHAVHHDPTLFPEPEKFSPERFLEIDTGKYIADPHIIPFNIGKRSCLGEALAKVEMLLFFAAIFQRYSVELCEVGPPEMEELLLGSEGGVHAPGPHKIKFIRRE